MSYSTLPDPVVSSTDTFCHAVVNFKFCNLGMVSSKKWMAGYLTILDGVVRLYDSRESYERDPTNGFVLKIPLCAGYFCGPLKGKVYADQTTSDKRGLNVEQYGFSLMYDYGIMVPLKQLKLACFDKKTADNLRRIIDINAN